MLAKQQQTNPDKNLSASQLRQLKKYNKLSDKKAEQDRIKNHDFNNPTFTPKEWGQEIALLTISYKNPNSVRSWREAAKTADVLMKKTNKISDQGRNALAKGDYKKARQLQLRALVYERAAYEYLDREAALTGQKK